MNDGAKHQDREAMIADARGGALEPEEAAELALLADVLADPSTWAEPNAGLEDSIVRAVAAAEAGSCGRPSLRLRRSSSRSVRSR